MTLPGSKRSQIPIHYSRLKNGGQTGVLPTAIIERTMTPYHDSARRLGHNGSGTNDYQRQQTTYGQDIGNGAQVKNQQYSEEFVNDLTPSFLSAYSINAHNRDFHMGHGPNTGDSNGVLSLPSRPFTAGPCQGEGHASTYPGCIPLSPFPIGTVIPRDCYARPEIRRGNGIPNNTRPPPPTGPNPTLARIALTTAYNPLQDEFLEHQFHSQRLFASEGTPKLPNGFVPSSDSQYESVPQSPLDESFPPVARYLTGNLVTALRPDGDTHPRHSLLRTCEQCAGIPIRLVFDNLSRIVKINEGVYGEVYSGYFQNVPRPSIYKIVAVEGKDMVNGEKQKRYGEIEPEIRVSKKLNTLRNPRGPHYTRGYCRLYRARLLEGAYPEVLTRAWKVWHNANKSENDCPKFGAEQRYIVFEYEFAGKDVECYSFRNAEPAYSVLIQIAYTLGVGEAGVEFEHRDLHWGNILVKECTATEIKYKIGGHTWEVPTAGVQSTVIDFTISRSLDKSGVPTFTDLAEDEEQFMGTDEYQFEIYRMMRKENGNNWSTFHPKTNIFWLHYLVDKLITSANYAETTSSVHKAYIKKMRAFEDTIMDYASCQDWARSQAQYQSREE